MMRHLLTRFGSAAVVLVAAVGCDPQLSPDYTGESLLTIIGSVEIAQNRTQGKLVPALAFANQAEAAVLIQDVTVRGQFPSDFRIDVFEPPPDEAFINLTHQTSGEPRMALGFVTAVSEVHPAKLLFTTNAVGARYGCSAETCDQPCGGKGCLVQRDEYCSGNEPNAPCYVEEMYCPTFNSAMEDCSLEPVSGDPALKSPPWKQFAGFSQNYMVAFLRESAPAGSVTAAMLGSTSGVPKGYGLYEVKAPSADEVVEREACTAKAEVDAATAWNKAYSDDLTTLDFEICAPNGAADPDVNGSTNAAAFCGGSDEAKLDEAFEARARFIEASKLKLGCALLDFVLERVENPASESISVNIGPEVQPLRLNN